VSSNLTRQHANESMYGSRRVACFHGTTVCTDVLELKSHIFQAGKVLESGPSHGNKNSWCDIKVFDNLSE